MSFVSYIKEALTHFHVSRYRRNFLGIHGKTKPFFKHRILRLSHSYRLLFGVARWTDPEFDKCVGIFSRCQILVGRFWEISGLDDAENKLTDVSTNQYRTVRIVLNFH